MEVDYLMNSYFNKNQRHKYSFGRSRRFSDARSTCAELSYELPKLSHSPQASFGYGNKYTFQKVADKNPSPFQYDVTNGALRSGFSFGIGRDVFNDHKQKITAGSYIKLDSIYTPSPTKYVSDRPGRGKSFSFISKHKEDSFIPESETPGPGTYNNDHDTDVKTGKRFNSRFRQTSIGAVKQERFRHPQHKCTSQIIKEATPGPGSYDSASINRSSKHRSPDIHQFVKAPRSTYVDDSIKTSITPGPVYYVS